MPASQAAANERRNDRMITHEPPKLKTTLKTPPKQATNPLQFVKVGPCSLYRTAQEQLQKVQEVKKIKQEIRDDPEDWQSNLDNWKSSRRKRQEHIIERVVEVKKLELEEHDRQRRRSKTFSEMMEERGNRGRKLSISLAMYNEEDANDLSDLGIGTSSGKSSVSGDTHDDTHSVLSDRDSEIDKNHSDLEHATSDCANEDPTAVAATTHSGSTTTGTTAVATSTATASVTVASTASVTATPATTTTTASTSAKKSFGNGVHGNSVHSHSQEYDSATTATASSPEPEEYTYEGAIRGYVSRVSQNIPRRSLPGLDAKLDNSKCAVNNAKTSSNEDNTKSNPSVVKVDIIKRREIFEKASLQKNTNEQKQQTSNRLSGDFTGAKSIKERLSNLEKQQKHESESAMAEKTPSGSNSSNSNGAVGKAVNRLSGDMSSIRERLSHLEKQAFERENNKGSSHRKLSTEELESVRPLRDRLSTLEKYSSSDESSAPGTAHESIRHNGELSARTIKERLSAFDAIRTKEENRSKEKRKHTAPLCFREQESNRVDASTPSERSSSPDSEYRAPRAAFHRSLDSLDADASSGPDTFERVQSLEELERTYDYGRRYPASSSSAELLNDTDREDSGIHTADVSCSVSQADEPVDEAADEPVTVQEAVRDSAHVEMSHVVSGAMVVEQKIEESRTLESHDERSTSDEKKTVELTVPTIESTTTVSNQQQQQQHQQDQDAVATNKGKEEVKEEKGGEEKAKSIHEMSSIVARENCKQAVEVDHQPSVNATLETISSRKIEEAAIDMTDATASTTTTLTFSKPDISELESLNFLTPVSPQQILSLSLSHDEEIVADLAFPLGPPTTVEPPKEKPPPPPVDLSDEENIPTEPLKRLNSTRRIKKELRNRRSDFLGIEGINDDELERELTLTKPPDMAAILAEERRVEQLHRRSYDTDSNYEQDSSHERDSGVELGHVEDWTKQPVSPDMSQHSRQSSEPFGASVTSSEEDEITKKEREIIEVLEKEEQWRYGSNRELNSDLGEKLAHKLRELEEEKMQLERGRAHEVVLRKPEEPSRSELASSVAERNMEELRQEEERRLQAERELRLQNEMEEERRMKEEIRIRAMESQIREQENKVLVGAGLNGEEDEFASREVLRVERELLQLEQEELKRQRSNLAYREQKQLKLAEQLQEQWKSLQDVAHGSVNVAQQYKHQSGPLNYRSSMPNLQLQDAQRRRPPPPPIPPVKPLRPTEQRSRDVTISRNNRVPSADSIPQQVDASLRHSASATTLSSHARQQMTRQTLQALSAAPRPRIVQGDQWVQRRKSDIPRGAHDFNYQHWLIQEAEHRRIQEKNQKSPARKSQAHVTGTSVPYIAAPTRSDSKPLPDSVIQTLTQRVQNRAQEKPFPPRRRLEHSGSQEHLSQAHTIPQQKAHQSSALGSSETQEKMLSVSGKKKCSHCGDELGRGAAMIIESLRLFYHMECFKCCVCHVRLGDGLMGTDVRVRNHKLHCHNCYSSDDGVKFSCV